MNSPRILLLCMQTHVCVLLLISPFSGPQWRGILLFQMGLRLFLILFLFGILCFCFKTRTLLSLLLCLPLSWFLPLHPLDLLVGLSYKKLSKFHVPYLCFPSEKTLRIICYIPRPHFFTSYSPFFSYSLFSHNNEASISATP